MSRAMRIDADKFLAMTLLLATTAGAPACGGKDEKKVDPKAAKAAPSATPAVTPPPTPPATPAPVTPPVETPPAGAVPADSAGEAPAASGGGGAKHDPGPEVEKPSW